MAARYKSRDIVPGSHADTVGCRYCPQHICRHCTGLKKCNDTWVEWEGRPDVILGGAGYATALPRE